MKVTDLLNGAKLITLPSSTDDRGFFVKTFHDTNLKSHGIHFELKESYFSTSKKNVIRGMHFQLPPHQHSKIVFCPQGAILDVIIDLRKNSPTFGQLHAEIISAEKHNAYFIPEGFAHGFKALTEGAMTYYLVSSEYSQPHDTGVKYDSFGFDWQVDQPILSGRDLSFAGLSSLESPF